MVDFRVLIAVLLLFGATASLAGTATAQSQVTLTVTVVDQDGDPISNVDVSATWDGDGSPVNETTRANGQALLDVPEGANVSIRIHDDRYVRNVPLVVEDATTRTVEVSVSRTATATVTVLDSAGDPVEDARVRLHRGGTFVTDQRTDADGNVTSPPIEEGEYAVVVSKGGFYGNTTLATFVGDGTATVRIEEGSVLVTVDVVDDHFDPPEPIRDASIRVDTVGTVQTLSDGEATLSIPVNDRYAITVSKEGYQTTERRVRIGGRQTNLSFSINRTPEITVTAANQRVVVGETVRLTVTDEYGDPVPNATVSRDGETVGETDSSGAVTVSVPMAGDVTFTAATGSLSSTVTVEGISPDGQSTPTSTVTPTEEPTTMPGTPTESTGVAGPGFTPAIAVVALLAATALLYWRRSRAV